MRVDSLMGTDHHAGNGAQLGAPADDCRDRERDLGPVFVAQGRHGQCRTVLSLLERQIPPAVGAGHAHAFRLVVRPAVHGCSLPGNGHRETVRAFGRAAGAVPYRR